MNKLILPVLLLLLSSCSDLNQVRVKSVTDGDTVVIQGQDKEAKVRLACIDAPEMAQPYGEEAKQRLTALIPVNSTIKLKIVDTDRYGRMVAEIYRDGTLVNLKLVQEGKAYVYRDYLSNCDGAKYLKAEEKAKRSKKGVWKDEKAEKPWFFRRK